MDVFAGVIYIIVLISQPSRWRGCEKAMAGDFQVFGIAMTDGESPLVE